MLARSLVLTRRVAARLAASTRCQPQFRTYHQVMRQPKQWLTTRLYSSQPNPQTQKPNQQSQDSTKEEETVEKESENKEENTQGKKEEENIDNTPIIEPEWKTARAGTFQKKSPVQHEVKVSQSVAYIWWILGFGGFIITTYEIYRMVATASKENSADPNLIYRKSLEQAIKSITENQKLLNKYARTPSVVEDGLISCQTFSNTTSISFPILQQTTGARVGNVYLDLVREGDYYTLRNANIDFVFGFSLDLVEAKVLDPNNYNFYLFAPEFSMQESFRQLEEQMKQQQLAQYQQQQPPQPAR
jgi:hypothetical protein